MLESFIRTVVPVIVGVLIGQAARIGLDLPQGAVTEIVTVTATAVYYAASRAVEQHYPAAGRWLLAAGLVKSQPVYRRV